jgi:hypothetical protein
MSGYPNFNFDSFHGRAEKLKAEGWTVYNPAEKDEEYDLDPEACETGDHALVAERGFDFKTAYLWDVEHVIKADAIFMLKGWEFSAGATGEHAVAVAMKKWNKDYEIIYE